MWTKLIQILKQGFENKFHIFYQCFKIIYKNYNFQKYGRMYYIFQNKKININNKCNFVVKGNNEISRNKLNLGFPLSILLSK